MSGRGKYGRGKPQRPSTPEEGAELLRLYAVKLLEREDGHAVDWPVLAQIMFKAAFGVADVALDDDRMQSVLRRVQAGSYDRIAGNEAEAFTTPLPMPAGPSQPGVMPRTPKPKLKP